MRIAVLTIDSSDQQRRGEASRAPRPDRALAAPQLDTDAALLAEVHGP